ncbi:MAG: hypothetical protein M1136_03295 [Chloroflexi bacterium]|nr:hypothetical protein [Chloroflexota bacterium]
MGEFLQGYGIWIVFGLFFLFMMWGQSRGHGGMGCGMGGHQHNPPQNPEVGKEEDQQGSGKHNAGCH